MQVRFDERGCKGFFKKYNKQVPLIKELIEKAIIKEIATGMSKIKLASRKRINGQKIYEFRLNLSTLVLLELLFQFLMIKQLFTLLVKISRNHLLVKSLKKLLIKKDSNEYRRS